MEEVVVLRGDFSVLMAVGKAVIRRIGNQEAGPPVVEVGRCIVDKTRRERVLLAPLGQKLELILSSLVYLVLEIFYLQVLVVEAERVEFREPLGDETAVVCVGTAE